VPRDLIWDAIYTAAERLAARYPHDTLQIRATRRRSVLRWTVAEGLSVEDDCTDVFEPVRQRRLFGNAWTEVQSVQDAASHVGSFMREHPNLA
jgi:hypothetical protein